MADAARNKEWQQLGEWQVNYANADRALVATGSASEQLHCKNLIFYRGVAQLVARLLWEQDVGGSNPFTPTKNKSKPPGFGLFFFVMNRF